MPKAKPSPPSKFSGFSKSAPGFWHELAVEMNKEWFEQNKQRYQDEWVAPMYSLLGEVRAGLAKAYAPLKLGEPKVMRIYRDVRFSKDKTPYKTHVGAHIPVREGVSAMYVHLGMGEEFVGCGTYFFESDQLGRWRKLVGSDATGKPLAKIVAKLHATGYEAGGHDDYKKVPKPFPADHPRAALLKLKGLTAGFPDMPRGMLHSPKLVGWLVQHGAATAPLVSWLAKNMK